MGFRVCVRTKNKPQISLLRYAPVEMTNLLSYVRLCIDWKNHNLPKTNLSSRPERSGVERSVVLFNPHADFFSPQIPSRPGGPSAKRQPSPEGLGRNLS